MEQKENDEGKIFSLYFWGGAVRLEACFVILRTRVYFSDENKFFQDVGSKNRDGRFFDRVGQGVIFSGAGVEYEKRRVSGAGFENARKIFRSARTGSCENASRWGRGGQRRVFWGRRAGKTHHAVD